jgi:hypothetical protein
MVKKIVKKSIAVNKRKINNLSKNLGISIVAIVLYSLFIIGLVRNKVTRERLLRNLFNIIGVNPNITPAMARVINETGIFVYNFARSDTFTALQLMRGNIFTQFLYIASLLILNENADPARAVEDVLVSMPGGWPTLSTNVISKINNTLPGIQTLEDSTLETLFDENKQIKERSAVVSPLRIKTSITRRIESEKSPLDDYSYYHTPRITSSPRSSSGVKRLGFN